jgi:hypothetical protein
LGRPTTAVVVVMLIVAVIAGAIVAYAVIHERHEAVISDAARNEAIVNRFGRFPGSELLAKFTDPRSGEVGGRTTTFTYSIPGRATSKEVADHYGRELRGWQRRDEEFPCVRVSGPPGCPKDLFVTFTSHEVALELSFVQVRVRGRRSFDLEVTPIRRQRLGD